jgi:rhamnosyltransferase
MTRPRVLVLLAAYNGSEWIAQQIETILNQEHVDVDLVISDDGSTDDTLAQIDRFSSDPRVRKVSAAFPTRSAAQNFLWLIRNTPADGHSFVSFADQDDVWHKEKLYRASLALEDEGSVGYSCAVTAFWDGGRSRILRQNDKLTASDFLFEGAGQGCTFVLSKAFYDRIRKFLLVHTRETAKLHYHDWAIYALSRSWGQKWLFDDAPMVRYRQHTANDTGARASRRGIERRLRLIKNGWYQNQVRTVADLCLAADPTNSLLAQWSGLLAQTRGSKRKYRILRFCMRGGRRRKLDQAILLTAVIAGFL